MQKWTKVDFKGCKSWRWSDKTALSIAIEKKNIETGWSGSKLKIYFLCGAQFVRGFAKEKLLKKEKVRCEQQQGNNGFPREVFVQ